MKILSNRYKLLEVVGNGGMSVVYKAEDLKDSTLVAIKILKEEFLEDEDILKRFRMESEAIGKLDNEHVVKVLDVGVDGADNYIVMELLKPDTLQDLIRKNNRFFDNAEIINMALQILRGIQAAHQNDIVHRDIKPQNILIGENGVLKVSDFGIARVATRNTMKNTKDAMGSVHYASPEQSRGSIVDKRSDIYSFGILLYELATNRLPFEGETPVSIALKHSRSDVVNPSYINLSLNLTIEAIILKAMQKEPCHRFESVDEIIEIFEELEKNPKLDLSSDSRLALAASTDTIDMSAVKPFLDGEKEQKNRVEVSEVKSNMSVVPMIIAAASAVLIAGLILFFIFWTPFRDAESAKPFKLDNLVNMSFSEASDLMSKRNIKLEKTDAVHNSEIEKNKIISQIPGADSIIKEGMTVKVVVSLGKGEVTVPNLIDLSLEEARVKAGNEGLKLKVDKEFSDKKQGSIIRQSPSHSEKLESGDVINVVVSLGKESSMITMPGLINKTSEEAIRIINEKKLIIGLVESEYSDKIAEGLVTSQSVAEGTEIAEGTKVNLKLSLGSKPSKKNEGGIGVDEKNNENKPNDNENTVDNKQEEPANDVTSFYLPLKQDKEAYKVKVIRVTEAGEEVVYDNEHPASDGSVRIDVVGNEKSRLKFFIDDVLIDEKEVGN